MLIGQEMTRIVFSGLRCFQRCLNDPDALRKTRSTKRLKSYFFGKKRFNNDGSIASLPKLCLGNEYISPILWNKAGFEGSLSAGN